MIEILSGTLEEHIIALLQKIYPITITDIVRRLHVPRERVELVLHKFQVKGIVKLEPLPDKTYIRLLRADFHFIGGKHKTERTHHHHDTDEEDLGIMYS
ncbi:MAG TPA: transcriptional regulator [Candidatus Thermoplasmatota archaeon]|nr:transcriptional regulator [Candidatus Thermoplasmatota archaeon]